MTSTSITLISYQLINNWAHKRIKLYRESMIAMLENAYASHLSQVTQKNDNVLHIEYILNNQENSIKYFTMLAGNRTITLTHILIIILAKW